MYVWYRRLGEKTVRMQCHWRDSHVIASETQGPGLGGRRELAHHLGSANITSPISTRQDTILKPHASSEPRIASRTARTPAGIVRTRAPALPSIIRSHTAAGADSPGGKPVPPPPHRHIHKLQLRHHHRHVWPSGSCSPVAASPIAPGVAAAWSRTHHD